MTLHAVVLAGGRSSRMGRDKVLLEVDGRSLLERALTLLQDSGAERIIISGQVEGRDSVPDLYPHSGPPGGLLSALHELRGQSGLDGSPLLLIPVDMPLLTPPALRGVLKGLGQAQAAHYDGEVFPCVFRASEALHAHLEALFAARRQAGGARSMKALLAWAQSRALPRAGLPDEVFLNVNRPEEWEAFLARERSGAAD